MFFIDYIGMDEICFFDGNYEVIFDIEVFDFVINVFVFDDCVFIIMNSLEIVIDVIENDVVFSGCNLNIVVGLDYGIVSVVNGEVLYQLDVGYVGVDQF